MMEVNSPSKRYWNTSVSVNEVGRHRQQRIIIGTVGGEPDAPRPDFTEDTDFDITRKTS